MMIRCIHSWFPPEGTEMSLKTAFERLKLKWDFQLGLSIIVIRAVQAIQRQPFCIKLYVLSLPFIFKC